MIMHVEKLKIEYFDLEQKIGRLQAFLNKHDPAGIGAEYNHHWSQLDAMQQYLKALQDRIDSKF